ncbi:hypothetical protein [Gelidibacter gilvus]|uniref:Uncharacterized protein n=1 Tax=Gelidibacter gilvus TaxID=59602 RepID=A0A4Q0XC94_9FLAO|nr:hypothetical protein [Gelidibacter gilvus]RXJ44344.1 hypothetical protein ESZ48_18265 [Gelidibacter gilvus]
MSSIESKITDDHDIIKKWTEERYGEPALVEGVVDKVKAGEMLRIHFSDNADETLKDISWELFYEIFDENNLAFLYQEKTIDGVESKFYKFITRT